jgi:hypothetical protein
MLAYATLSRRLMFQNELRLQLGFPRLHQVIAATHDGVPLLSVITNRNQDRFE